MTCSRCGHEATADRIPIDSPIGRAVVTLQVSGRPKPDYFLLCPLCLDLVERTLRGSLPCSE